MAETAYLQENVGEALKMALAAMVVDQPDDAVEFIGTYLVNHATKHEREEARAKKYASLAESIAVSDAAAAEVAAKAQADRLGERVGGWEIHEKGVASRLMAKMGYVRGSGLGKHAQGRTDILPIPAPRRGTRDCENPGLGAPEAAPVEAPPLALAAFRGRLLVAVGASARLYDLGKRKLLRKAETRVAPALVVRVAVVGDRLSTDILAANEIGALSVHTRPLDTKGDNPAALVSRFLENRLLLPLLRRLGAAPPTHPAVADLAHTQPGTALPSPPSR